jgi:hypothetical protein
MSSQWALAADQHQHHVRKRQRLRKQHLLPCRLQLVAEHSQTLRSGIHTSASLWNCSDERLFGTARVRLEVDRSADEGSDATSGYTFATMRKCCML